MFKKRSYDKELIDDFHLQGSELVQNLKELHIINKFLGGYAIDHSGLKEATKKEELRDKKDLRIIDIGCGGGDTLNAIDQKLKSWGIDAQLIGLDANPAILDYARNNCKEIQAEFYLSNAMDPFPDGIKADIALFSLFFHHFKEEDIKKIIENTINSGVRVLIINDLHRHFLAYYSIKFLTIFFSKSRLVKHDAPLSVRRGFIREEWKEILNELDLEAYSVSWKWAFRWKVMIFEKRQKNG